MRNGLFLLFALVFWIACDKDEKKPAPSHAGTGGGGNPGSSTTVKNGLPQNTGAVHGVYYAMRGSLNFLPGTEVFEAEAAVHFTPMPLSAINPMSMLVVGKDSAGKLLLNGNTMKFEKTNPVEMFRYKDTSATRNYSAGVTWSLSGTAAMPGFSATVSRGFPAIASPSAMPGALSKSGFTFSISAFSITNADSLNLSIFGPGVSIIRSFAASTPSVAISAAEMNGATIGQFMTINLMAKNYSHATISGKTHVFGMARMVVGSAVVN